MNLIELLDKSAGRWAQKPAIIEGSTSISYSGLAEQVSALALQLQTLDLAPGSRIGLCYPNSIRYVALTFAIWKIGAVVVPVPTECTEEDLEDLAKTMELQGILSQKPLPQSQELDAECFFLRRELSQPDNHGLNIAFIRFTSGTTSARKGVVLCHETVRDRVRAAQALGRGTAWSTERGPMVAWGTYDGDGSRRLMTHLLYIEWFVPPR